MIAVTDTSAFSGVELITPSQNIALTVDIVNQELTGSAIINSTITDAVKTMLVSILENGNVSETAISKIAEYTGFSLNTSIQPSAIEFDSNNVSLDKLTFYIIFRLPYTSSNLTYEDIAQGDTSNTISGNPSSWGKYANYIRGLNGSGIKKLKSEGVDFDLPSDYFTGNAGYVTSNAIYDGSGGDRDDGIVEYNSDLFDASSDYNKLPASFFRLAQDENPYVELYKEGNYNKIHWPEPGIYFNSSNKEFSLAKVHFEREIELLPQYILVTLGLPQNGIFNTTDFDLSNYANLVSGEVIESDADGFFVLGYHVSLTQQSSINLSSNRAKYYFQLKNNLLNEVFDIEGCEIITRTIPGTESYSVFARKVDSKGISVLENERRYLLENFKIYNTKKSVLNPKPGFSGLTFGAGLDLGAAFIGAHEKGSKWKIRFVNGSSGINFKLHLGKQSSASLVSNDNELGSKLRDALWELIRKHYPSNYNRTTSSGVIMQFEKESAFLNNFIVITKINEDEYDIFLNAPLAYFEPNDLFTPYDGVSIANISSTLLMRSEFETVWKQFKKVLLRSFNLDLTSDDFSYLDGNMECYQQGGLMTLQEQIDFQRLCKDLVGVKGSMAWVKIRNNFDLMRKFEFGLGQGYVWHLRALYNEFYLPRYYNRALDILTSKGLITTPNEVEKYVFASIQYNKGGVSEYAISLVEAINSHDHILLKKVVKKAFKKSIRSGYLNKFIDKNKINLYKDVE